MRRSRTPWVRLAAVGTASGQTPPGVLIVAQIAEPKSLDPHAVTAVNDFRILVNLYDGLTRYKDGTLEVEPALAESWEISDDGTVYTFTLREGVTFHDGSPLNAEAIKFNFDRMLDEEHPFYDTGPFPLSFFFSAVESVETPDESTVVITLNEPYAPFLSNLAYPTGLLVSPASVEQHGAEFGRNPFDATIVESDLRLPLRTLRLEMKEAQNGGQPQADAPPGAKGMTRRTGRDG